MVGLRKEELLMVRIREVLEVKKLTTNTQI
jgi:hypothetical protein